MKRHILMLAAMIIAVILSVGSLRAQDAMKMKGTMNMAEMKNSPHHKLMMARSRASVDACQRSDQTLQNDEYDACCEKGRLENADEEKDDEVSLTSCGFGFEWQFQGNKGESWL